jgi:hypothetical protein
MFIESDLNGRISAAYVEEQYPGQKWLPASDGGLRDFLVKLPKLGKDSKGRTCLLPSTARSLPEKQAVPEKHAPKAEAKTPLASRVCGRMSSLAQVSHSLTMRFTAALYEDTQREPLPWRWIGDTAQRAGIRHHGQFELALTNAKSAGLLVVDDGRSVTLTSLGIRAARGKLKSLLETTAN